MWDANPCVGECATTAARGASGSRTLLRADEPLAPVRELQLMETRAQPWHDSLAKQTRVLAALRDSESIAAY